MTRISARNKKRNRNYRNGISRCGLEGGKIRIYRVPRRTTGIRISTAIDYLDRFEAEKPNVRRFARRRANICGFRGQSYFPRVSRRNAGIPAANRRFFAKLAPRRSSGKALEDAHQHASYFRLALAFIRFRLFTREIRRGSLEFSLPGLSSWSELVKFSLDKSARDNAQFASFINMEGLDRERVLAFG